jgi:hypothetical protein
MNLDSERNRNNRPKKTFSCWYYMNSVENKKNFYETAATEGA